MAPNQRGNQKPTRRGATSSLNFSNKNNNKWSKDRREETWNCYACNASMPLNQRNCTAPSCSLNAGAVVNVGAPVNAGAPLNARNPANAGIQDSRYAPKEIKPTVNAGNLTNAGTSVDSAAGGKATLPASTGTSVNVAPLPSAALPIDASARFNAPFNAPKCPKADLKTSNVAGVPAPKGPSSSIPSRRPPAAANMAPTVTTKVDATKIFDSMRTASPAASTPALQPLAPGAAPTSIFKQTYIASPVVFGQAQSASPASIVAKPPAASGATIASSFGSAPTTPSTASIMTQSTVAGATSNIFGALHTATPATSASTAPTSFSGVADPAPPVSLALPKTTLSLFERSTSPAASGPAKSTSNISAHLATPAALIPKFTSNMFAEVATPSTPALALAPPNAPGAAPSSSFDAAPTASSTSSAHAPPPGSIAATSSIFGGLSTAPPASLAQTQRLTPLEQLESDLKKSWAFKESMLEGQTKLFKGKNKELSDEVEVLKKEIRGLKGELEPEEDDKAQSEVEDSAEHDDESEDGEEESTEDAEEENDEEQDAEDGEDDDAAWDQLEEHNEILKSRVEKLEKEEQSWIGEKRSLESTIVEYEGRERALEAEKSNFQLKIAELEKPRVKPAVPLASNFITTIFDISPIAPEISPAKATLTYSPIEIQAIAPVTSETFISEEYVQYCLEQNEEWNTIYTLPADVNEDALDFEEQEEEVEFVSDIEALTVLEKPTEEPVLEEPISWSKDSLTFNSVEVVTDFTNPTEFTTEEHSQLFLKQLEDWDPSVLPAPIVHSTSDVEDLVEEVTGEQKLVDIALQHQQLEQPEKALVPRMPKLTMSVLLALLALVVWCAGTFSYSVSITPGFSSLVAVPPAPHECTGTVTQNIYLPTPILTAPILSAPPPIFNVMSYVEDYEEDWEIGRTEDDQLIMPIPTATPTTSLPPQPEPSLTSTKKVFQHIFQHTPYQVSNYAMTNIIFTPTFMFATGVWIEMHNGGPKAWFR